MIEAMKQALEALEILARYENPETRIQVRKPKDGGPIVTMYPHKVASDAAQSLRQAIEQAEKQEPVAHKDWCIGKDKGPCNCKENPFGYFQYDMRLDAWVQNRDSNRGVAFYTTPQPQHEWVGLTDEEIKHAPHHMVDGAYHYSFKQGAEWAEAKLRSKNT